MKRQQFYPKSIPAQVIWLTSFANKLPGLAATLGLTPAQAAAIVADCLWLIYVLQEWEQAAHKFSTGATGAAAEAQFGDGSALMVLPAFESPALPAGAVPVNTGALYRIFALVQTIKKSGKCTDTNAGLLGIVGTEQTGPDATTLLPLIALVIINGQVLVKWGWGGYAAFLGSCEIWVDRNDGKGFVFLTIDTTPGYTDTQAFPAALTKWTYKAIYRMDEKQFGLWSQPASISVPA